MVQQRGNVVKTTSGGSTQNAGAFASSGVSTADSPTQKRAAMHSTPQRVDLPGWALDGADVAMFTSDNRTPIRGLKYGTLKVLGRDTVVIAPGGSELARFKVSPSLEGDGDDQIAVFPSSTEDSQVVCRLGSETATAALAQHQGQRYLRRVADGANKLQELLDDRPDPKEIAAHVERLMGLAAQHDVS